MIDCESAIEIAKKYYYEKNQQELTKFYDADNMWIAYGGRNGQTKFGNIAITIDKETGEIKKFILPSKDNFEVLKHAKQINFLCDK